jgi:lipid A ethanolaminephosphotransferase
MYEASNAVAKAEKSPQVVAGSNALAKPTFPAWGVSLIFSLLFTAFYNQSLFQGLERHLDNDQTSVLLLITVLLFLLNHLILSLLATRFTLKWWLLILLLCSSITVYFSSTYGVMIDKTMLQNAIETDLNEIKGLLDIKLLVALFFYFLLPFWFFTKIRVRWSSSKLKGLFTWGAILLLNLILISTLLFSNYQTFSSIFRNFREVKHLAVPFNDIDAVFSYVKNHINNKPHSLQQIALDAKQDRHSLKPTLMVLVVGETARADHFSINGYPKPTTPNLQSLYLNGRGGKLFNFSNVYSCGTATAVSVPCMFSMKEMASFDLSEEKYTENVLDVMTRAGVEVLWLDNNSGCKGVCARVENFSINDCNDAKCTDLDLVKNLKTKVNQFDANKDHLVVLHQLGSHGPEYFKRSTGNQKLFTPECETNQFQECEPSSIVNSYDNSIFATDEMLNETVSLLDSLGATFNTALIYVSDHGESLGEEAIYLHGLPYAIAPEAQKHIPMVFWLSHQYIEEHVNSDDCINQLQKAHLSHDDLFPTLLKAYDVDTEALTEQTSTIGKCFI